MQAAVDSLAASGFQIERPPEDWLFKAYVDEDLVDVLHRLAGVPVERELIDTATERDPRRPDSGAATDSDHDRQAVVAVEHYADFAALLPAVRAVREQLDWQEIVAAVKGHPFAEAFLVLVDRLGIADPGISDSEPSSEQEPAD